MLPVSRPSIGHEELEELKEVEKVFSTGWLGLGSTVFKFESKRKLPRESYPHPEGWGITPSRKTGNFLN